MSAKIAPLKRLQLFFISQKNAILIISFLTIALIFLSLFFGNKIQTAGSKNVDLSKQLKTVSAQLEDLKNQDQYKKNQELQKKVKDIEDSYKTAIGLYQRITDLRAQNQNTKDLDTQLAQVLNYLSKLDYDGAQSSSKTLDTNIQKAETALIPVAAAPQNVPANNSPPGSGFSAQSVSTDSGTFTVYIVAADLNSTRVIVDTASNSDCANNCPTLPLADYVSRNGAFAGINGTFFCPAEYPSCAGKTNSFDTLLMNKNKVYFNSSNNVYSTIPLVYFTGSTMGARDQSSDWGRDTGVDAVIANHPLYISGGNNNFGGSSEQKLNDVGTRTFVANKGSMVYIGIIFGATSANAAAVLKTMGMDNALGLDQGGSTALWSGGYKAGPGRNIPNALLFVRK